MEGTRGEWVTEVEGTRGECGSGLRWSGWRSLHEWAYPSASTGLAAGGRHRPVSVFDSVSEGDKLRAAREAWKGEVGEGGQDISWPTR